MSRKIDDWLLDVAEEPEKQKIMLRVFMRMIDEFVEIGIKFSLLFELDHLSHYHKDHQKEFAEIGFFFYKSFMAYLESELETEIGYQV